MSKFRRCKDPADPRRCQGVGGHGQCPFEADPGSQYCIRHGSAHHIRAAAREDTRIYRLAQWQVQYEEQANHPKLKSIRDEIAVLRIILQERLGAAKSTTDLIIQSGSLSQLLMQIGKLVVDCQKIEKELGQMLDKTQATQMAQELVGIIAKYIDDPDLLTFIAEDMTTVVDRMTPPS